MIRLARRWLLGHETGTVVQMNGGELVVGRESGLRSERLLIGVLIDVLLTGW